MSAESALSKARSALSYVYHRERSRLTPDTQQHVWDALCAVENAQKETAAPFTDPVLAEAQRLYEQTTQGEWRHYRDKLREQFSTRINEVQCGDEVPVVGWQGFDDSARSEKKHAANAAWIAFIHNHWP